jgi:hypothetical protein
MLLSLNAQAGIDKTILVQAYSVSGVLPLVPETAWTWVSTIMVVPCCSFPRRYLAINLLRQFFKLQLFFPCELLDSRHSLVVAILGLGF